MMVKSTKTLLRALTCIAFLVAAPLSAVAQQSSMDSPVLIDVFQDGSLYITYDEYLDRQRRVLQAQRTGQVVAEEKSKTIARKITRNRRNKKLTAVKIDASIRNEMTQQKGKTKQNKQKQIIYKKI